jgi:hypothetical protein
MKKGKPKEKSQSQTTAEAPEGLARRTFLTGLAVTLPIAAAVATPALASPGVSRNEIDRLYEERTELAARSRELVDQYKAAEASMPSWAQAGCEPRTGAFSGWPAICDVDGVPSTRFVRQRPSPTDIRKDCEELLRDLGESKRSAVRAEYRHRMRELIARLRLQREEKRRVGLPDLEAQLEAVADRMFDLDDGLQKLEVPPEHMPRKAAAVLLITSHLDHHGDKRLGTGALVTLDALRPFLTGLISEHAEYVVANPNELMATMPFWPG